MKSASILVLMAIFFNLSPSFAACMKDNFGSVFCSIDPGGSIAKDRFGDLVCGPGECLTERFNEIVCSKFSGGILVLDNFNTLESSPGPCEKDNFGHFICSAVPRGAVYKDNFGNFSCEGGCVAPVAETTPATQNQCHKLSN